MKKIFLILSFLFFLPTSAMANSFASIDSLEITFTVEGMEKYKESIDSFVSSRRKTYIQLGELWFWATPSPNNEFSSSLDIEIEYDDGDVDEYWSLISADEPFEFWAGGNHVLVSAYRRNSGGCGINPVIVDGLQLTEDVLSCRYSADSDKRN